MQMIKFTYDFELERIEELINASDAKCVGLQLPEGVRTIAAGLVEHITGRTDAEVIISGNSCYGACDIDTGLLNVVDILFHFGHTPYFRSYLSPADMRKVHYIELRSEVDVKPVAEKAVDELEGETVCVVSTLQHVHRLTDVKTILEQHGKKPETGKSPRLMYEGQVLGCDFSAVALPCDEVLFIGSGSFHPAGLALYTGGRVVAADPFTTELKIFNGEAERKKRYMAIARACDATSIGIIIGMKSGQFNLVEARRLKDSAIERGKRAYLIAMNDIIEERLLGYRVDAFVNTACPRLTEDISVEVPVLSAREFEIVLGLRDWENLI